jgi:ribosomal protein S18 acetylase RimI-like enzyme
MARTRILLPAVSLCLPGRQVKRGLDAHRRPMDTQRMGTEAVALRRAETKDLPGIMRLQLESYEASLLEPQSLFETIIAASPDTCLAAEHQRVIAGYLLAHPITDDFKGFGNGPPPLSGSETVLYLHDMCVSPAHRNQGIGRLLFDALSAHLASERFTSITAVAVQGSESFWRKRGFEIGAPYAYPGGAAGHIITKTGA